MTDLRERAARACYELYPPIPRVDGAADGAPPPTWEQAKRLRLGAVEDAYDYADAVLAEVRAEIRNAALEEATAVVQRYGDELELSGYRFDAARTDEIAAAIRSLKEGAAQCSEALDALVKFDSDEGL